MMMFRQPLKLVRNTLKFTTQRSSSNHSQFWRWTTQERANWKSDWREGFVVCSILAVTGSSSMFFVRPALKSVLGIEVAISLFYQIYRFKYAYNFTDILYTI